MKEPLDGWWFLIIFLLLGTLALMIDAATPPAPHKIQVIISPSSVTEMRETLTPKQCRVMAEHLRRDHGLKVRVLSGVQVTTGTFVWQDLTVELIGHPGFVFSYPHYLGNLRDQEVLEEDRCQK